MINKEAILRLGKAGFLASIALGLVLSSGNSASFAGNFQRNHPRRAEVLRRDRNIGNRIYADRGHLDGHYGQLRREDRNIHRQERRDARINGGYITRGQKQQLNREENRLNRQIRHDQ